MRQSLPMTGRALGAYLAAALLCLITALGVPQDQAWLQILLCLAILAGLGLLLFSDAGVRGERAATLTATMARMQAEGRMPDPDLGRRAFAPKTALLAWLLAALPLVLAAGINLIAEPFYPPVLIEEAAPVDLDRSFDTEDEAKAYLEETLPQGGETAPADAQGSASEDSAQAASVNPFSVAARILFIPLTFLYGIFGRNPHGLNLIFLAFALFWPLPMVLGYLRGPALRKKKLEAIEKGKKRKMRNLKVNKRPRTPQPPKMEV